jgi:hypothetical protein
LIPESIETPPAFTPVADEMGNAGRPWYLYFAAVTRRLGVLLEAVLGWSALTHQGRLTKVTTAGTIGESARSDDDLETLWGQRRTVTEQTLTAASTAISAPTVGQEWILVLKQDATGGRAITFAAGITYASLSLGTAAIDSYSVFHFIKLAAGSWIQVAPQLTDLT